MNEEDGVAMSGVHAVNLDLVKGALGAARGVWHRFFVTLLVMNLLLVVDYFSGESFLSEAGKIPFLGMDISRSAFSITYCIAFGLFILWSADSAKTTVAILRPYSSELHKVLPQLGEYRLWSLSPIHPSKLKRICFWGVYGYGLFWLLMVAIIHLVNFKVPDVDNEDMYQRIGIYCLLVLVGAIWMTIRRIYPAWQTIRQWAHGDVG